jgi:hypothetical protein
MTKEERARSSLFDSESFRELSIRISFVLRPLPAGKFPRQPLDKTRRAHERITNFLLAIFGPMFILGKNCGAFEK